MRPLARETALGALELAAGLSVDPRACAACGVPRGDGRARRCSCPASWRGDQTLLALASVAAPHRLPPYTLRVPRQRRLLGPRARPASTGGSSSSTAATGRRVALVGHSRGGHFARALAHRRPELVSHAVSLGADLQRMFGISAPTRAAVHGARRGGAPRSGRAAGRALPHRRLHAARSRATSPRRCPPTACA